MDVDWACRFPPKTNGTLGMPVSLPPGEFRIRTSQPLHREICKLSYCISGKCEWPPPFWDTEVMLGTHYSV